MVSGQCGTGMRIDILIDGAGLRVQKQALSFMVSSSFTRSLGERIISSTNGGETVGYSFAKR